ncbi:MAG: Sua5/YciO/YrdC/YwlC family protein [Candidatus Gracilibacteria bacterium]|nr:Sua5/YciO/YrdC/YwlC family protein [Candidatus Gracilibacteria bacterium]
MIYLVPTDTCYGIACAIDDIKNYEKIYKIKKRSFEKPLAIMILDFAWLKNNTTLNEKQIEFLKDYDKPFTVLTNSSPVSLWLNYEDENGVGFHNRGVYKKIAFRVANNETQKKLIKSVGPIFLTSANTSGDKEIYKIDELEEVFSYYLDKKIIEILPGSVGNKNTSDIFEFVGDSVEVNYLRKSYDL